MSDWVVLDRSTFEHLRRCALAWKRKAKVYQGAFRLQQEFTESWYRAYRRAWRLDEPDVEDRVWGWLKGLFGRTEVQPTAAPKDET